MVQWALLSLNWEPDRGVGHRTWQNASFSVPGEQSCPWTVYLTGKRWEVKNCPLLQNLPQGDGGVAVWNWCISRIHMELWSKSSRNAHRWCLGWEHQTQSWQTEMMLQNCILALVKEAAHSELRLLSRVEVLRARCQLQCRRAGGLAETFYYLERSSL